MKRQNLALLLGIVLLMVALVGCSSTSSSSAGKVGTATDGSEVAIEKATIKYVK
ncbi:MAG TPA: hypothetical protein VIG98_01620 [Bacillus sp. (in: firmicutes)]|jgi:thiosulfate/3-mercaptopyruvate sulfurtransferase